MMLDVPMEVFFGVLSLMGALALVVTALAVGGEMAISRRWVYRALALPFTLLCGMSGILLGFHSADHIHTARVAYYLQHHTK